MKRSFMLLLLLVTGYRSFSQDFNTLLEKGDEFYAAGNYTEAIRYFTKAIAADPKQVKGYWYRGDSYFHSKQYNEAIKDYTKAIELDPSNWNFFASRGDSYYYTQQYAAAEKDYDHALTMNAQASSAYLSRANLYAKLEKKDKACTDYQQAQKLGERSAKGYAKELGCEWANAADKPCPPKSTAISKVEVDPFTGAVFVSKGLHYSKFEFISSDKFSYLTGNNIAKQESFTLKLVQPTGFCETSEADVLVGTGFVLYDAEGKELGAAADIYEENQTLPAEYLKSLSIELGFSELEAGKDYRLKVRFYDKRSTGEVLVELPFHLGEKSDVSASTRSSVSSLGLGIRTSSVNAEAGSLSLTHNNTKVSSFALAPNKTYKIALGGVKELGSSSYTLRLVNAKGDIVNEERGKTTVTNGSCEVSFTTKAAAAGECTIWLKLDDGAGSSLGITIPGEVK